MNIWILNHYAVPQRYYYLARSCNFARELTARGNKVTIFAASSVHNSDINLIDDGAQYRELDEDGLHYVLFRARQYSGSGAKRVVNHIEAARRMERLCPRFTGTLGRPDVIFASAGQSLTLVAGIRLAKKLGVKCVCEVTDLWPESFVAYGLISKTNPLLPLLYAGERWIYEKADALIFSMEGGRDYIREKRWDREQGGSIDLARVHHINNGVDLAAFDGDLADHTLSDPDLEDGGSFKAVYTGSVRRVNQLSTLAEAAASLQAMGRRDIKILVYGAGDELQELSQRWAGCENIIFKGRVDKKYIPFILSRCDLCLVHSQPSPIYRYGMSLNKTFDYMAAGKPLLMNFKPQYDYISAGGCGVTARLESGADYAKAICAFADMDRLQYAGYCRAARAAAEGYDYKILTDRLLEILQAQL